MRAWFSTLVCLLLVACCGSPRQTHSTISVVVKEFSYVPAEWRIPAGQVITLNLTNQGKQPHDWILLKDPPKEPFDAVEAASTLFRASVAAGESLIVTFRAPAAPGEYSVTSAAPDDLEKGLTGRVVVVQPGY